MESVKIFSFRSVLKLRMCYNNDCKRKKNKFFTFRSVLRFKMWYNNKCQEFNLKKKVEKIAFRSVLK